MHENKIKTIYNSIRKKTSLIIMQLKVACVPNGWDGGWHSTPVLQWVVTLSGAAEMQVSSGKVIKLVRGVSVLLTDTTGKGHNTTVVGDEGWCSMLISI